MHSNAIQRKGLNHGSTAKQYQYRFNFLARTCADVWSVNHRRRVVRLGLNEPRLNNRSRISHSQLATQTLLAPHTGGDGLTPPKIFHRHPDNF